MSAMVRVALMALLLTVVGCGAANPVTVPPPVPASTASRYDDATIQQRCAGELTPGRQSKEEFGSPVKRADGGWHVVVTTLSLQNGNRWTYVCTIYDTPLGLAAFLDEAASSTTMRPERPVTIDRDNATKRCHSALRFRRGGSVLYDFAPEVYASPQPDGSWLVEGKYDPEGLADYTHRYPADYSCRIIATPGGLAAFHLKS